MTFVIEYKPLVIYLDPKCIAKHWFEVYVCVLAKLEYKVLSYSHTTAICRGRTQLPTCRCEVSRHNRHLSQVAQQVCPWSESMFLSTAVHMPWTSVSKLVYISEISLVPLPALNAPTAHPDLTSWPYLTHYFTSLITQRILFVCIKEEYRGKYNANLP